MPIFSTRCSKGGILAVAVWLTASPAHAQDPEATALFKTGKELAGKGQWQDACPKFEASYKREKNLGTLMNLADCHEHIQRLARAWGEWNTAAEIAAKAPNEAERADLAKRRATALEPRLPKLRIDVRGAQPELSVYRDDDALDPGAYGTELPVDPGTRTITVRRGSAVLATEKLDMKERAHERVAFDLDAIAKEHPAPAPSARAKSAPESSDEVPEDGSTRTMRIVGNASLGIGLVALIFGGTLEGAAVAVKGGAECIDNPDPSGVARVCSSTGLQSIGTARNIANAGLGLMIGGGVLTATGIALKIVAYKRSEAPAASVGISAGPERAFVTCGGTF
jgi:hypothetical protein